MIADQSDPVLSVSRMRELRALREHELSNERHFWSERIHRAPVGFCRHCGDPATCHDMHGELSCRECWMELVAGLIPPPEFISNAPHKPANVSITSIQRPPGSNRVDYFGDHEDAFE